MWEESKVPSVIVMSEREYRELGHCSYSFLSRLDKLGYRAFMDSERGGLALNLGSYIDAYILTPEELEDKFYEVLKHPTGNKKLLADFVSQYEEEVPSLERLYEIAQHLNLWGSWKKETTLKEFDKAFLEYLEALLKGRGKIEYSAEDVLLAESCMTGLLRSELTEPIFNPEEYGLEVLFQQKGIFELDDLFIKFMVDILVIDPKTKTIHVYDLKTGEEDLDSFEKAFLQWRYDIQHFIYTKGVEEIKESLGYADFKVEPLKFIYISKKTPDIPVIYSVPKIDIYNGYTTKYGYQIKGVKQLLDDFKFYNSGIKVPRRFVEGGGEITLDI